MAAQEKKMDRVTATMYQSRRSVLANTCWEKRFADGIVEKVVLESSKRESYGRRLFGMAVAVRDSVERESMLRNTR
jgi:hypothetical protein